MGTVLPIELDDQGSFKWTKVIAGANRHKLMGSKEFPEYSVNVKLEKGVRLKLKEPIYRTGAFPLDQEFDDDGNRK